MDDAEPTFLNTRRMGEDPELYVPGRGSFYPVHLGDILNGRYSVFRKLGAGAQSTVWLARDTKNPESRSYVAVKVFSADSSESEMRLADLLKRTDHPGRRHVELALDSFVVYGSNGRHFCKVLEPLGCSLAAVLEAAFEKRAKLNDPEDWRGVAVEGDTWSAEAAKHACYQLLQGLDYLHSQQIAHCDIQPGNVCLALDYDLAAMSENEIQQAPWVEEEEEESPPSPPPQPDDNDVGVSDTSSSSSSSSSQSESEWEKELKHQQALSEQQWAALPPGDPSAPPHSPLWNAANLINSRFTIELLQRRDGRPPAKDEIQYTVLPTPLPCKPTLLTSPSSQSHTTPPLRRLVLIDLGFSTPFPLCPTTPLRNLSDFRPPEALLENLPPSPSGKSDVFSLGLLFWEIVMLRRLVETRYYSREEDPDRAVQRGRQLRDLAQRIGPVPGVVREKWKGWEEWLDEGGKALGVEERDETVYEEGEFEWGDVWDQARQRRPRGMCDEEMREFVEMVLGMLAWVAEERPTTGELLESTWFASCREGGEASV
ncbi:kinase-like protein [Podospora aff. communis PSN243]|uniref:non-specific serine/threonine protein kinase n=1 Tax=Podospora aff. communis PSN243 TaxID=3040156 RepID=A0AAV9GRW7_9PEZI|nr:kinase-like protein [Podospora aff. communis PSN243]